MADIATIGAGAVGGATAGSSIAPGWGTVVGATIGALVSWYGMSKQEEANKSAESYAKEQNAKTYAEDVRRYNTELGLKREELAYGKAKDRENLKLTKEQRDFDRMQGLSNRILSIVSTQPQLQDQIIGRWKKQPQSAAYDFKGLNPIGKAA